MKLSFIDGTDLVKTDGAVTIEYRGVLYTVPDGFTYNGANIPALLWGVMCLHPYHSKVRKAALLHDYMYSRGLKEVADKAFKRLLKEDGLDVFRTQACYWAVRIFGKPDEK